MPQSWEAWRPEGGVCCRRVKWSTTDSEVFEVVTAEAACHLLQAYDNDMRNAPSQAYTPDTPHPRSTSTYLDCSLLFLLPIMQEMETVVKSSASCSHHVHALRYPKGSSISVCVLSFLATCKEFGPCLGCLASTDWGRKKACFGKVPCLHLAQPTIGSNQFCAVEFWREALM